MNWENSALSLLVESVGWRHLKCLSNCAQALTCCPRAAKLGSVISWTPRFLFYFLFFSLEKISFSHKQINIESAPLMNSPELNPGWFCINLLPSNHLLSFPDLPYLLFCFLHNLKLSFYFFPPSFFFFFFTLLRDTEFVSWCQPAECTQLLSTRLKALVKVSAAY